MTFPAYPFDTSTDMFPGNVVDVIAARFLLIWPGMAGSLFKRRLKQQDLTQSVGIFPIDWSPDEESYEFPSREPTVQRYLVGIQSFTSDTDEESGNRTHQLMAKSIRAVLYSDSVLNVGLGSLSVTINGVTERIQRRGISRTRYLDNQISGSFLYLAQTEMWVETESK